MYLLSNLMFFYSIKFIDLKFSLEDIHIIHIINKNINCLICFKSADLMITDCCKKHFCNKCIQNWLSINYSCPHCRSIKISLYKLNVTVEDTNKLKFNNNYCINKINKIYGNINNKFKFVLIKYNYDNISKFGSNIELLSISFCNFIITKQLLLKNIKLKYSFEYLKYDSNIPLNINEIFTISIVNNLTITNFSIIQIGFN